MEYFEIVWLRHKNQSQLHILWKRNLEFFIFWEENAITLSGIMGILGNDKSVMVKQRN